ncbi:Alpha/Beta hydrolase protein [Syncephalis fuscata]|nr:Alpha/Beta hydrolase protein [Syncephalis fuscata]
MLRSSILLLLTAFAASSLAASVNDAHPAAADTAATADASANKSNTISPNASVTGKKPLVSLPQPAIQSVQVFATFAAVATCNAKGWNCGPRCEGLTAGTNFVRDFYDQGTNTYAYIATNDKYQRIIVSFRGSVDVSSWIQNLNFGKTQVGWLKNNDAWVHAGFLNCYEAIRNDLKSEIASLVKLYPKYTVTFTGHSLGAALAVLASVDARISTPSVYQQTVTFGEPRVGNPAFANMASALLKQAVSSRTGGYIPSPVRVVNYDDIVPRLPPTMFDYQHHDTELWISTDKGDQASLCESGKQQEDPNCARSKSASINVDRHNNYFGVLMGRSGPCTVSAPTFGSSVNKSAAPQTAENRAALVAATNNQ